MKNLFKKRIVLVAGIAAMFGIIGIAHAQFYPTNGTTYYIQSPLSATATSVPLTSFLEPGSNVPYTMGYLNSSIEFATIDPTFPGRTETISFTGITQNSNGTAVLTGVTRGLTGSYPYTASSTLGITHSAQAVLLLSDSAQVFNQYLQGGGNNVITGSWTFASTTFLTATSTASTSLTNLGWIQTLIGTATSSLLGSNNTWTGTNAFTSNTTFNTVLPTSSLTPTGSTQLATKAYVDGVAISGAPLATNLAAGIVRIASSTQIAPGGTFGTTTPYALTTQFASSTASSTSIVVTTLASDGKIDPSFLNGTAESYKFNGTTSIATSSTIGSMNMFGIGKHFFASTSPGTNGIFTAPAGIFDFCASITGAGGTSQTTTGPQSASGGGGAGGTALTCFTISGTTTISFTIGSDGGNSTLTASTTTGIITYTGGGGGGGGGSSVVSQGGPGGTATNGYMDITGGSGNFGMAFATGDGSGGTGGSSIWGSGGIDGAPGVACGSGAGGAADSGAGQHSAPGCVVIYY